MHYLFKTFVCLFLFSLASLQLAAQCSNISNPNRVPADNHIFSGQSFGQSIVASAACYGGNQFTKFSFMAQGNSPTLFDLRIFQGQTVSGTPRYMQTGISLSPPYGGKLTIELTGGTGDLTFVDGQTYTFLLTGRGGNLIAYVSDNATPGQVYLKDGFDSGKDLLFEIGTGQCSNISNRNRVRADNHIFSGQSFGQSIVADAACYGGNTFSEFSFWSQGNSPTRFDLRIYEGQTVTGTPRYTQTDISLPPANMGGKLTIELKHGTGDLSFVDGDTYTFLLSGKGGNLIAHVSEDATPGQVYLKIGFDSGKDLLFEVKAK